MAWIEHGQLLDEPTVDLLAQRGIWLSGQYLSPNNDSMSAERQAKRRAIVEGNDTVWPMAKKASFTPACSLCPAPAARTRALLASLNPTPWPT